MRSLQAALVLAALLLCLGASAQPRVVSTSPAAGSCNTAGPNVIIEVKFSEPMVNEWSLVASERGEVPELVGDPWFEDPRTWRVRAKVAPGKTYGIGLNSPTRKGFRSAANGTALEPFSLVFETAAEAAPPQPPPPAGHLGIHSPYTTAPQLRGQKLFIELVLEPADARVIFEKVWQIQWAVASRLAREVGSRLTHLHIGDCSAALLSEPVYRDVVLPMNQEIAWQFEALEYHSCGGSTHLLADFAALPKLGGIQLGPGTDLAESARLMPGVHLQPLIDPVPLREGNPDGVGEMIRGVLDDTSPAPRVTLCVWSLDRETPAENVAAIYETVEERAQF